MGTLSLMTTEAWEARGRSKIQLCGSFFVELDGSRVEQSFPGRQGRVVFAYLAAHRDQPVARSILADVLWPRDPPTGAETSLRGLIFRLRQTLGGSCLTGKSELRLVLPKDVWIDREAARGGIHEAESAIALGRPKCAWLPARISLSIAEAGFMAGYEGAWIDEERRELEEIRLRALECVAETAIELGGAEVAAAERAGRALIAAAPFRESGYRYLMTVLEAEGNTAEALRVYGGYRGLVREELGISPSRALREHHARLVERQVP